MGLTYREEYEIGFREGRAEARVEALEIFIEYRFPEVYKDYKIEIRRLSEYESKVLLDNLSKSRDIAYLFKYIKK